MSATQLGDRERMNTAMWHIQVLAGFFLKRTGTTDQTIQYLTRMHRQLRQRLQVLSRRWGLTGILLHRSRRRCLRSARAVFPPVPTRRPEEQSQAVRVLRSLPDPVMSARNVQALRAALRTDETLPLVSYRVFAQINQKTRTQSVRDVFVKLLLQVRHVGVDKAAAVARVYPTADALFRAYLAQPDDAARRALLADLACGVGARKRKLGQVASDSIFASFCGSPHDGALTGNLGADPDETQEPGSD